jgi:hypothetical protein
MPFAACPATVGAVLACRLLGHRPHFSADGPVMRWSCERGCGAGGEKRYASAADAARYAEAFDRRDIRTLGRRAPYFGLFPLRIWHWVRTRRARRAGE